MVTATTDKPIRPSWNELYILMAKLFATKSSCLAQQVGAVIVKDNQVLAIGYNGPLTENKLCLEQGFCYEGVEVCTENQKLFRSIDAEINAIAQAAKAGISVKDGTIFITQEPSLNSLKAIVAAGIIEVNYGTKISIPEEEKILREEYLTKLNLNQILLRQETFSFIGNALVTLTSDLR